MFGFRLSFINLLLIFAIFTVSFALKELSLNDLVRYVVKRGQTEHFCVSSDFNRLSSLYQDVNVYVVISNTKNEFQWHSVRGKSTDDFHTNVKSLVTRYVGHDDINSSLQDVDLESSFFRDLLSACPSPLFPHHDKSVCKISFSTNGRSCVSVTAADKNLPITVLAKKEISFLHVVYLVIGFSLLMSAPYFSVNPLFQYLLGISFFISTAFALITLFILQRSGSKITKNIFAVIAIFLGYFILLYIFVQSNIRGIVIDYWELGVFYAAVMFLLSIAVIKNILLRDQPRHIFRVGIKWMIRCIGLVLLYNSSSSPMIAQLVILMSSAIYVVFTLTKRTKKPLKDRKYRE